MHESEHGPSVRGYERRPFHHREAGAKEGLVPIDARRSKRGDMERIGDERVGHHQRGGSHKFGSQRLDLNLDRVNHQSRANQALGNPTPNAWIRMPLTNTGSTNGPRVVAESGITA